MNKKQTRKERQRRKRNGVTFGGPVQRIVRSATSFSRKHWLAISGIIIPIIASFLIYHLSYLEPDIRFINPHDFAQVDRRLKDNKFDVSYQDVSYQKGTFQFKNLSTKAGYVDKVEFVPSSLALNTEVRVLEIERVRIGWGEEKDIEIKWMATSDVVADTSDYIEGRRSPTKESACFRSEVLTAKDRRILL